MAKYSSEEKIQAALRYINGTESLYTIARSIGTDDKSILIWVRQYEYHGVKAFKKRYTNCFTQFVGDLKHKDSMPFN